jgi:AcrR family transcriptional regulator
VAAVSTSPRGLRERKKQRTRETIVEVGTRLFALQGYSETTLVQVADEAEVALSTIFNYFSTKADIVFAVFDGLLESARDRVVDRPAGEPATDAVLAWITEVLPEVERPYTEAIRRLPEIVASDPELAAEERLRLALLEDAIAIGFERDLGDSMRARVMAAIALGGMVDVWNDWYKLHATDAEFDLVEVITLKAEYIARALEAGLKAIEMLPSAPSS